MEIIIQVFCPSLIERLKEKTHRGLPLYTLPKSKDWYLYTILQTHTQTHLYIKKNADGHI